VEQLLLHLFGDYIIQSDWMALEKTKKSLPALIHVLTYTLPFLLVTQSIYALAVIAISHFVIDRWRLIRYVCWVKNLFGPKRYRFPWEDCSITGYHKDRSEWLAFWLMIISDNILHLTINYIAITYV